jgi:CheY-like chemotaxis protein
MAPKFILIVDDALDLGHLLQATLNTYDPTLLVSVVPSAEEAILDAERHQLSLLIADFRLPGMNGFELIRRMRKKNPQMKVILITGMDEICQDPQIREVGVDACIIKPMEISSFLETVQGLLGLNAEAKPLAALATAEATSTERLGDVLSNLRRDLNALVVCLVDDMGRVHAQAGDFPDPGMVDTLLPAIINSAEASDKVSRLIGSLTGKGATLWRGNLLDAVALKISDFSLLVLMRPHRNNNRLLMALSNVLENHELLLDILSAMGVTAPIQPSLITTEVPQRYPTAGKEIPTRSRVAAGREIPSRPRPPSTVEASVNPPIQPPAKPTEPLKTPPLPPEQEKELAELLGKADKKSTQNADAFWDSAASKAAQKPINPDAITYDQAKQLGLGPKEEDNH